MHLLTPRQREIVAYRCQDELAAPGIARALGVTESTVKNHVSEILRRLGRQTMCGVCWHLGYEAANLRDRPTGPAMRPEEV